MEPAKLQVNRKARRVKTGHIDVGSILHTLVAVDVTADGTVFVADYGNN